MVTLQKSKAPAASSKATLVQPAAPTTLPVAAAQPMPFSHDLDSTCFVHRLEEALQLVEAMKLTENQTTKITQLTSAQTARCAEAKKQHKASHEQILALLTPDQRQILKAAADDSEHCHEDGHSAPAGHTAHA
jgi:hypothetical protein